MNKLRQGSLILRTTPNARAWNFGSSENLKRQTSLVLGICVIDRIDPNWNKETRMLDFFYRLHLLFSGWYYFLSFFCPRLLKGSPPPLPAPLLPAPIICFLNVTDIRYVWLLFYSVFFLSFHKTFVIALPLRLGVATRTHD
jgi:hypothetical protein